MLCPAWLATTRIVWPHSHGKRYSAVMVNTTIHIESGMLQTVEVRQWCHPRAEFRMLCVELAPPSSGVEVVSCQQPCPTHWSLVLRSRGFDESIYPYRQRYDSRCCHCSAKGPSPLSAIHHEPSVFLFSETYNPAQLYLPLSKGNSCFRRVVCSLLPLRVHWIVEIFGQGQRCANYSRIVKRRCYHDSSGLSCTDHHAIKNFCRTVLSSCRWCCLPNWGRCAK